MVWPTTARDLELILSRVSWGGVPVRDFEIDDVDGFDAAGGEGLVVVVDGGGCVDEDAGVAEAIGGGPDEIVEGFVGVGVALQAEFAAADDVGEDESANILEIAAHVELGGHLTAAVAVVGIFPFEIDGFFAVEKGDPDLIAAVLAAEVAGDFEHDRGGRAAVIGTDEVIDLFCVVMRGEHDDAGAVAGNFHQNIFHGDFAGGSL